MNRPAKSTPPAPLRLQDAKARFSAVVDAAMRGEPQHVTRRGKPAVVIVGADEFERLSRAERSSTMGFIEYLRSMPRDASGKSLRIRPSKIRLRDVDLTP